MTIFRTRNSALLFVCGSALIGALGCVSSDKGDGATGGAGGTSSTTGGSGGASATGGSGGSSAAVACMSPTAPLISDFAAPDPADSTRVLFTGPPAGGTYFYPSPAQMPMPAFTINSDSSKGNWHVSGTIGDYSGFGLYFDNCSKVDASAYKGVQFTIHGSVAMGNTMTFSVGTAGDEVAASWLNAHKAAATDPDKPANFGRCMPVTGQYDGTCNAPTKSIPVTATATTVTVLWADLVGGKPEATVNPSEITFMAWAFPPPAGAGTAAPTTYMADVTIDDLQFVP